MKKRIIILTALTAIGLLAMSGVSMAATSTRNLNVTASVVAVCNVTNVTDVVFGVYDTTSASNATANGDLTFRCTKNTQYRTYITGTRTLTGAGADTLLLELWADGGYSTTFPSASGGALTPAANNQPITVPIYGRILAGQDVGVDSYSRLLVATVEY